jgi:hypothetical protein
MLIVTPFVIQKFYTVSILKKTILISIYLLTIWFFLYLTCTSVSDTYIGGVFYLYSLIVPIILFINFSIILISILIKIK